MESCRLHTKFACRPTSLEALPHIVTKAVRSTISGRPGVAYIDLPGDLLRKSAEVPLPRPLTIKAPIMRPLEAAVKEAVDLLSMAERPLVIVGKGAAFSRAESLIRDFITRTNLPFLPTPMGKGCVPDSDPHSVAPARYSLHSNTKNSLFCAKI